MKTIQVIRASIVIASTFLLFLPLQNAYATFSSYAEKMCSINPNVSCFVTQKGDSWASLWPDPAQRQTAMLINRMNIQLRPGLQLIDPDNMSESAIATLNPFPQSIGNQNERTIIVSLGQMAWAAYDADGSFVRWGAASGGRGFCSDINARCVTPQGDFTIYRKASGECASTKYPIPDGGAPMPYCMFFKGGFAMHGSQEVPGYNASHGCVRMLTSDAQWLNQEFITVGVTKVIVRSS